MMPYELEELQAKEKITPQKKIANNFIQNVITSNTESALKIVWYLASIFNKCDMKNDINTFEVHEKDIEKQTNLDIRTIRRNLKAMMKTTVTFVDEEKKVDKHRQLIPGLDIQYDGTIKIDVYTVVAKMIIEVVHENTTFINIPQLLKLNNKHSIRLLPLLETISKYDDTVKKQKTVDLKWCNSFFGTSYKALKYIDTKILSKVKEELDNNSTLTFTYKCNKRPIGKGRPAIVDITITPKANNNYQSTIFFQIEQAKVNKKSKQTLEDLKKDKYIKIENTEILKEIEALVNEQDYVTEMRIFIDYCIDNNKHYDNYARSFLTHLKKRKGL